MIRDTPPFVGGASYLYENLWGWELGWRVQKKKRLFCSTEWNARWVGFPRAPHGEFRGVGLRVRTKMALQMGAETFDALYIDRLTMNIIIQRLWQHSINSLQRRTSNVTIAWVLEVAPGSWSHEQALGSSEGTSKALSAFCGWWRAEGGRRGALGSRKSEMPSFLCPLAHFFHSIYSHCCGEALILNKLQPEDGQLPIVSCLVPFPLLSSLLSFSTALR